MSFVRVSLLAVLTVCLAESAHAELRAGAAKVDITPRKWPVEMVGQFYRRQATKAFDALHARALVLDDGEDRIAIVIVDNCLIDRQYFDEAKRRAAKACGIRADRIMAAATHTHTAPAGKGRFLAKLDPDYIEQLQQGIADAVTRATANLQAAEVGWGTVEVPEEVFNRRWFVKQEAFITSPFGKTDEPVRMNPPRGTGVLKKPAGPIDPVVSIVSVRSADGRPIALLGNYALHYVGGIPAGGVSADYFGEFCRLVEERFQPKVSADDLPPFVALLSNGTSGDINNVNFTHPRPRAEPFERMRAVATRVSEAVLKTVPKIDHRRDVEIGGRQTLLKVATRVPTPRDVANAKSVLEASEEPSPRTDTYARWTLELAEPPHQREIVLQAFRIGDLGITSIPCEVLVEIGLEVREKSPFEHTFTIELANGHYGYLPTPRQHALGGYETWLGTCILEIRASEKITENLLKMLQALHED